MRVVFMGSDTIALPMLEVLAARSPQLCVVSQPDRPSGRGQQTTPNAVSAWAIQKGLLLLRPEKLDAGFVAELKKFAPEIIFVMAYGRMLKLELLDLPRLGTWNLHGSMLPQLRGASPVETAIAEGHSATAVGLMRMVLQLDAGPVGPVAPIKITEGMTSAQLRAYMAQVTARLLEDNYDALATGKVATVPQDDSKATYCRLLTRQDSWLDPLMPAEVLVNRVRAFGGNIGSCLMLRGERLKIHAATRVEALGRPGQVLATGGELVMAAGKGALKILSLQRAGGKVLPASEFLRGFQVGLNDIFEGQPLRPLVSPLPFPRGF